MKNFSGKQWLNFVIFFLLFCWITAFPKQSPVKSKPIWKATLRYSFDGSHTPAGKFRSAAAIDIDGEENIYIVDSGTHRLIKFSAEGQFIREVGGFGRQEDQFDTPLDVCARNTINIYVADYNNGRVVRFDKNLNFLSDFVSTFEDPYHFERVRSLVVSAQNDLFILEDINNRVIKFNRFMEPLISFGGLNEPYGQLLEPHQISLDNKSRLWVTDPVQDAIVIFDYFGNFILTLNLPELQQPLGLFAGGDNFVYVVDGKDRQIVVFNPEFKWIASIWLTDIEETIVDVAVQLNRATGNRKLYALTPKRCNIYDLKIK